MYRVIDGRGTGKTRKLLEECGKNDGVLFCQHPEYFAEKCRIYNIPVVETHHINELTNKEKMAEYANRKIYIDEIESILRALWPNLTGYTMSLD